MFYKAVKLVKKFIRENVGSYILVFVTVTQRRSLIMWADCSMLYLWHIQMFHESFSFICQSTKCIHIWTKPSGFFVSSNERLPFLLLPLSCMPPFLSLKWGKKIMSGLTSRNCTEAVYLPHCHAVTQQPHHCKLSMHPFKYKKIN